MSEIELAWAAGFFDGEGHISCFYTTSRYSVCLHIHLQISQNEKEILDRFKKAVGRIGAIISKHKKGYYQLRVNGYNTIRVFNLLKPYLSKVKLEQGEKAIQEYEEYNKRQMAAE